jgi:hypothetical protein
MNYTGEQMMRALEKSPAPVPACLLFKSECDSCGYCRGGPVHAIPQDELKAFVLSCLRCSLCELPQMCDTCVHHQVLMDFSKKYDFDLGELEI